MYTIPPIKTVDELTRILHTGPGYDGYSILLQSIKFGKDALEKYCTWDPKGYTRNKIEKLPSYELAVLCWEKGQSTPVHDHSNQESWFIVIEGELMETVFNKAAADPKPLEIRSSNIYRDNKDVGYMTDSHGLHKLQNSFNGKTISIHLYTGSDDSAKNYDEQTGEVL